MPAQVTLRPETSPAPIMKSTGATAASARVAAAIAA